LKIKTHILFFLRILAAASVAVAAGYYFFAMKDIRRSIEGTFSGRVQFVSTYISMVQQQVDGMSRTIAKNYGSGTAPETSGARYYREHGVWGLSGYAEDKGVESLAGTCTGIGFFPLPASVKNELSAAVSIDSQIKSILAFNKNVVWIYYTSAEKFLYLAPKLRISDYRFSLPEYNRPFWSQAVPENNPGMKQIISDLYEDSVGKGLMITISSPVQVNAKFIGVMSLDLGIDLLRNLSMIGYIPGETILADENGRIVARIGDFSKDETYPLIPIPGSWFSGDDGFFWIRSEIGGGELNMLHRIKKVDYYFAAARRSLFVWSLSGFMIILFALVSRDIKIREREETAQRESEEALRKSEERFNLAMTAVNDGLWDWNMEDNTVFFDKRYYTLAGYEPDEFPQDFSEWAARVHPEDIERSMNAIDNHVRGRTAVFDIEFRFRRKNGTWMWIRGRGRIVARDSNGKVLRMIGTHTDVTDRREAEDALIIFSETVENSTDAIGISTPQGAHYYQNRAFTDLFGDIVSKPVDTVYVDRATGEEVFKTIMSGGQWAGEVKMYSKNREILEIDLRAYANRNTRGVITAIVGIHTDITEKKHSESEREKLQEQLSQSQKMESVGRLAGGIAHDFNNMLGVIIGQSELALMRCDNSSPVYKRLVEIEKAARRSAELTSQLLAFARKQTVAPRVIDLNEAISGMISMLRRLIGEEIELEWHPGEALWPVRIDPSQINQILANLSVNARDAINGEGKIFIETLNITVDDEQSNSYTEGIPGDYVLLNVRDTGCGFSREVYEHIFEPFFTTKGTGKGTGLGLAMVYGIIRQNSGHVSVESNPGKGTLFRICFPRNRGNIIKDETPDNDSRDEGSNETILLVEDEPMLLEMSRTMLEELGYSVVAVPTPAEAIRMVEGGSGIKLLITDVIMPGMNGKDLALKIRSVLPEVKSIYMSGYTADIIAHHGVLDEGVNFIQKPFKINELAACIKKALS
jgi:PAS domain S-box-containing protein